MDQNHKFKALTTSVAEALVQDEQMSEVIALLTKHQTLLGNNNLNSLVYRIVSERTQDGAAYSDERRAARELLSSPIAEGLDVF